MKSKTETKDSGPKLGRNLLVYVDSDLKTRLKTLADRSEMTLGMYVREVLKDAVKTNPQFRLVAEKVNN